MSLRLPQMLPFVMPPFARFAWVSDEAQMQWVPRIERIGWAWQVAELASVQFGARPAALVFVTPSEFVDLSDRAAARGLAVRAVSAAGPATQYQAAAVDASVDATRLRVVVGQPTEVGRFVESFRSHDHDVTGELLGYPACCRAFFSEVWQKNGCLDTTWAMVSDCATDEAGLKVRVRPTYHIVNPLLRWAGLRAVPHLACSFHCAPSAQFAEAMLDSTSRAGFEQEVQWLREALSWPVAWSALHGIAEVRTPLFKMAVQTDATPIRYVVEVEGSAPPETPNGLTFPYSVPRRRLTDSASFRRGLTIAAANSEWLDNGFVNQQAMDVMHGRLIAALQPLLEGLAVGEGDPVVVDLGCGSGSLLRKLPATTKFAGYGIEMRPEIVDRWGGTGPHTLILADIFDTAAWAPRVPEECDLGLVSLARFNSASSAASANLLSALRDVFKTIVFYSYDGQVPQDIPGLPLAGLSLEAIGRRVWVWHVGGSS